MNVPHTLEIKQLPTSMPIPQGTSSGQLLAVLCRVMSDPSVDMERLERAEAMYERAVKRDAEVAFSDAFADAKAEIPVIEKNRRVSFPSKTGPAVEYNHEDLGGIAELIDPILGRHGLTYRWEFDELPEGRFKVTCILAHRAGHFVTAWSTGSRDTSGQKNDYQARQSAETYLKRSTLKAAAGLATRERDDDGRAASTASASGPEYVSTEQLARLNALADELHVDKAAYCRLAMRVQSLAHIPAADYNYAVSLMEKKRKQGSK